MKRIATATIIVVLVLTLSWWAGERFDASPTMRDNLPSDASHAERNQP